MIRQPSTFDLLPSTLRASCAFFLLSAVCCLLPFSGCGFAKEKPYTPSEAETKLVEFCKKEGGFDITTRRVEKTAWIYLALSEPIFDVRAAEDRQKKATRESIPFSLLSLDGEFNKEKKFAYIYDIVPDVLSPEATEYGSAYNENYSKKRQLIYQGLQETFFNIKTDAPEFIIIIVCDITKGIATDSTLYLPDLIKFMSEAIPFEEYYMREVTAIIGSQKMIGDKTGKTLDYTPMTWTKFLTEQTKNRIRFKFTQSDFKPETKPDQVIITIAANTLKYYPFSDYAGLYLYNRREKREMSFSREQLKTFEEKSPWENDQGRITVIHFDPATGVTGNDPQK